MQQFLKINKIKLGLEELGLGRAANGQEPGEMAPETA